MARIKGESAHMEHINFLIQCEDRKGLVCDISSFFFSKGFNILHCQQHTDLPTNKYFMRLKLDMSGMIMLRAVLEKDFAKFAIH
jgi:formyltetrahydrofolate deformylase